MKLELGSGQSPTKGYIPSDITDFGLDSDVAPYGYIIAPAWAINLDSQSLDEVLALGCIEHLTYTHVNETFANVRRMLKAKKPFLFDVPDIDVWAMYLAHPGKSLFSREQVLATIYGWQRWPGDEHKSGWNQAMLQAALEKAGFTTIIFSDTAEQFTERGIDRRRFHRPHDAHIYCTAWWE